MSTTELGIIGAAPAALRSMLSACTSFQKLVKAASAAAALSSIYLVGDESDLARPFAIVEQDEWAPEQVADGASLTYVNLQSLGLYTEFPLRWTGAVTAEVSATVFTVGAFAGLADDFFNHNDFALALKVLSGDRAGEIQNVSDFAGASGQLTLASGLTGLPGAGSNVAIYPATSQAAWLWFWRTWGDIWSELQAQSGNGGLLALRDIRKEGQGRSNKEEEQADYIGASWTMRVGR